MNGMEGCHQLLFLAFASVQKLDIPVIIIVLLLRQRPQLSLDLTFPALFKVLLYHFSTIENKFDN